MENHDPETLDQALCRLRGDPPLEWPERAEVADQAGDRLCSGASSEETFVAVEILRLLADDTKWEVRKEVADALMHLRTHEFDVLIARLAGDSNAWVRKAAERTLARRRKIEKVDTEKQQRLEGVFEQYEWFLKKYDQTAADRALKIGERYFEILASSATHELRGILTALKGSLDWLASRLDAEDISRSDCQESLAKARERVAFFDRILGDMKGYAQELDCAFRTEKLADIMSAALDLVKDELRAEDRRLADVEIVNRTPDHISLDTVRHQLVQAFSNVLKNAHEALKEGGRIEIDAHTDDDGHVEVTIQDTGTGMAPVDIQEAFVVFRTSKRNAGGTGFGLPIARKIVEAHGGKIRLSCEQGNGTTATIILPRRQQ